MTVSIAPELKRQEVNANGVPYSGAKLFSYVAGTSIKKNTYTSSTGLTANPNPIILDSAGRTPNGIWLTDNEPYDFVLAPSTDTDPPVSPIWAEYNISTVPSALSTFSEWVSSGLTPTYISAKSFTVPGNQTAILGVGRRLKLTTSAGTIYGTIVSSVYTSLTTVEIVPHVSTGLDSGLSAVYYGLSPYGNSGANTEYQDLRHINWTAGDTFTDSKSGSTTVITTPAFTLGQTDVTGEPVSYTQDVVTSVAGAGNFAAVALFINDVRTFAGQSAVFQFWAKADSEKNIAVEFRQVFGTGGAPSATVFGIGVTTINLTTVWKRFFVPVDMPSIAGKTIGTNNDSTFRINIWMDAGSSSNAFTNSLGQQSGTFSFAKPRINFGRIPVFFIQ